MNRNQPVQIFSPTKKMIFALVIINLLVLAGSTVNYLITNDDQNAFEFDQSPLDIMEIRDSIYWVSEKVDIPSYYHDPESSNPSLVKINEYRVLSINKIDSNNKISRNDFAKVTLQGIDDPWVNTNFSFKIVGTQDNTIILLVTEKLFTSSPANQQNIITQTAQNQYFMIINNFDSLNAESIFIENYKIELPANISIADLEYNQLTDKTAILFTSKSPHYSFQESYRIDPNVTEFYYVTTGFTELIVSASKNVTADIKEHSINYSGTKGNSVFTNDSMKIDFEAIIEFENNQNFTLVEVPNLKYPTIELFDSSNVLHLTGEFNLSHSIEGEISALNKVDYVAINTETNESQYWDLFWWETYISNYEITFTETSSNEIVLSFIGPDLSNYFENPSFWSESPIYNQVAFENFLETNQLQIARFNPFVPTLENFIQFDPVKSQSDNSDVFYPRLHETITIPTQSNLDQTNVFLQGYIDNSGNEYIYMMAMYFDTTTGLKHQMNDGSSLIYPWEPYSGFLFIFENKDELVFRDIVKYIGTDATYDEKSKTLERNVGLSNGWAIRRIFDFIIRPNNDGFEIIVFFSGSHQKSAFLIPNHKYHELAVKIKDGVET